jgi:dephospho-CoA kinase
MRIIQISGKGRVGKTTLAHLIAKHAFDLGYIPVMLPFADGIKKMAAAQGITKEGDSSAYRDFCQNIGANKRAEDPDYWVTKAYETIQEYMIKEIDNKVAKKANYEYVIIQDDVRYMNELAFGRELVATQIFLSQGIRKLDEHNAEWRNHESEAMSNQIEKDMLIPVKQADAEEAFDIIINNDGDLEDLEHIVKQALEYWLDLGYLELEEYNEDADNSNP